MAIVIDPSITKGQGPGRSSPPPSHPPPSYNESTATQPLVVHPGTSGVPHTSAGYGPTPIGQQQQAVLPYYDPRSAHSAQAAKRRAKERFAGAVLWVVIIFALLSVLVWMNVRIQLGWSVSYCALLRAEPHHPLPSLRLYMPLDIYHLAPLVVSRCTYVDSKRVFILVKGGCSVHCALEITKKDYFDEITVKGSWTTQMTGQNSVATRCSPFLSSSFPTITVTTTMSLLQSLSLVHPCCGCVYSGLFGSPIPIG